jgi:hypothetical protein
VKAALEFYSNGVGDMPYEADFAVNRFGTEDAAFFDDIDNNEGYAASEYLSVGIEEAAPKQKQRGARNEDEAFDEAVEEFDQERAASAAFEGVEVLDAGLLDDTDDADAPWAWEGGAGAGAAAAGAAVDGAAGEEDAILAQLAAIDFDVLKDEDAEQRELAAMVVDALGEDLELVAAAEAGPELADAVGLTKAEEAAIDEILAIDADAAVPALPADVAAAAAAVSADGLLPEGASSPLADAEVEAYLAALRGVDASAAAGDASALAGVRTEPVAKAGASAPLGDVAVPAMPASKVDASSFESLLGGGGDAEAAAALAAFTADLAEIEAISVADYDK